MSVKIFSYDLETSSLHPVKGGIHQMAFRVYVDYVLVKQVMIDVKLFPNDEIEDKALEVSGKTREIIASDTHIAPEKVYKAIIATLSKYCDKFNKADKFFLMGYNVQSFDNEFLRAFFAKNGDSYFGSWFWSSSLDVMILATQDLMMKRHLMKNFQLGTVAEMYGISAKEEDLHNAYFDLTLHESIWEKVSGIQLSRPELTK